MALEAFIKELRKKDVSFGHHTVKGIEFLMSQDRTIDIAQAYSIIKDLDFIQVEAMLGGMTREQVVDSCFSLESI